jgi:hypothetical protein
MPTRHMTVAADKLIAALRAWRRLCVLPLTPTSRALCLAFDRWEKTVAVEARLSRRSNSAHMVAAIDELIGAYRMWWAMRLPPLTPRARTLYYAIERYDDTYALELADKAARNRRLAA